MALTDQQKEQIAALYDGSQALQGIITAVGIGEFVSAIEELAASRRKDSAATSLGSACSLAVSDWVTIKAFIAVRSQSRALYPIMDAIAEDVSTESERDLGPLLVGLYAAVKSHLGK